MTLESTRTHEVRLESLRSLQHCLAGPHSEVALLSFLRFWAEVLVAVEYECLWPRLAERLDHRPAGQGLVSEFFYYHMIHDRRQSDIGAEQLLGGLTHSEELARHLGGLLESEAALQEAMEQVDRACELKVRFYDQFLGLVSPTAA